VQRELAQMLTRIGSVQLLECERDAMVHPRTASSAESRYRVWLTSACANLKRPTWSVDSIG